MKQGNRTFRLPHLAETDDRLADWHVSGPVRRHNGLQAEEI